MMEEMYKGAIVVEDRLKATITGVVDVDCFDNENIVLITDLGTLVISGLNFRINRLNVDVGEITIEGEINSLIYNDSYGRKSKGGFLSKMFK